MASLNPGNSLWWVRRRRSFVLLLPLLLLVLSLLGSHSLLFIFCFWGHRPPSRELAKAESARIMSGNTIWEGHGLFC